MFRNTLVWVAATALSGLVAPAQVSSPSSGAGQRTDAQIEMDVVQALDSSKALNKDMLTAETSDGEVTLSGTVSGEASSELADLIVSRVPGVTKVNDNLRFMNSKEPQTVANADMPGTQPTAGGAQANGASMGTVSIPEGTVLQVRTSESVDSKFAQEGTPIQFTVIHDVWSEGVLAIPRGATVHGVVTETRKSGKLTGSAELALKLTSLDLGGQSFPLDTDLFRVKGPSKAGETARHIFGGAFLGAIIGGITNGGVGAAIGAGVGAGAGTALTAATPGPGVWIPAEALVDFHLAAPLAVTPVSAQEAARLAQVLYPAGPAVYPRSYAPGAFYAGPPVYYAYPPVYYRPYYLDGGLYYWR
jgi:hypothetical protein